MRRVYCDICGEEMEGVDTFESLNVQVPLFEIRDVCDDCYYEINEFIVKLKREKEK